MLTLFELHVKETVGALRSSIHVGHHRVRSQNFAPIDEQSDGSFLAKAHPFADDSVELNGLEVVWDQESSG